MAATFSYAQAAKGATVAQTSLAPIVSQQHSAPPSTSSQGKDDIPTEETSLTAPSVTSTDADLLVRETGKFQQADIDRAFAKRPSDLASPGASSAPSVSSAADKPRRDADATSTETVTAPDTGDKHRVAGRQQTLPENSDKRERARKGKKGRNNDRDAAAQSDQADDADKETELPKPVFTEAPPPAVNVWAQRAMKAKMTQPPLAAAPAPLSLSPTLASSDDKKTAHSEDGGSPALNGSIQTQPGRDKPQRKANDFPRVSEQGAAPRKSLPRGSRATEKEGRGSEAMPPVEDSFSWPDPKAAAAAASAAEEPQRKPQDKGERGDKEGQEEASTSNKKKWVPVPFVPTVAFQTQLPPRGGKTRSAPRGGREAGPSRTNPHVSTGAGADVTSTSFAEGSATTAGSVTAAASKNTETRPRVGSVSARTISQPPNASKQRASVDNSMPTREARKSFAFANSEQTHQGAVGAPAVASTRRNDAVRATRNDATQVESGPVAPRIHSQDKPNGVSPKGTDYSKDLSSYVSNGVPFSGREGRPDRGRGGFRGGNRNGGSAPGGHTSQSSYSSNSQYPGQHPFRNAQQSSTYGSPPMYQGATFGPAPRGRGNNRANSNAANGRNNRAPHVPPLTPMSPIDYAVQQQQQHQQQPYLPYLQSVYDPNLINVTRQQLEYYLSVDNLCKDTHLRKRMDTQGFVPLNFIADFKRIRTILQEFNCAPGELNPVRLACQQSTKIDYVCGDDGIERLRNSKDWEPFVLKMHEREPEARNDGPKNSIPIPRIPAHLAGIYANNMVPGYSHVLSPMAMYPGLVQDDQRFHNPVYMNGAYYLGVNGGGANGRHFLPDSQLSAAVPEFSPTAPCPLTLESMTTLADEKIPQLVMILGAGGTEEDDLADKSGVASSHLNGSTPTAVNGSASKSVDSSVSQVLNGSASSKSSDSGAHEETVTNGVHHGQSPNQTVVWITETAPPTEGPKQLYTDARRIALALREQSAPGETPQEMQDLYQFWARILLRDFNARMYQEFRQFALEDASKAVPSLFGLKHLLRFYDRLIKKPGPKPWPGERAPPEIFQLHFNEAMEMNQHPKAAVGDARS